MLAGFPEGQHLRVSGAAHVGLGFQDPTTRAAIVQFFEGGRLAFPRVELSALVFERPGAPRDPSSEAAIAQSVEESARSIFGGNR